MALNITQSVTDQRQDSLLVESKRKGEGVGSGPHWKLNH